MPPVTQFLELVAQSDGTVLPMSRALRLPSGMTGTYYADETLAGGGRSVTGFIGLAFTGSGFDYLTEPGDYPASQGYIRLVSASAGIYGGCDDATTSPILRWNGSVKSATLGGNDTVVAGLVISAAELIIQSGGQNRFYADASSTIASCPDGASSIITLADAGATIDSPRTSLARNGSDRVVVNSTSTIIYAPDGTTKILEVDANGWAAFGSTPTGKASAYTQTYSTATRTNNFAQTVTYTGIDNAQGATPYAKVSDLEALRAAVQNLAGLINAGIDDAQARGTAG